MLLYVLESKGSSPGRQGFFMAVNIKGQMEGSIGGGIMEHKFIEMAKEKLQVANASSGGEIRKQVHDKAAAKNQSGMICSGEQTNFLYRVQSSDLYSIEKLIECLIANKHGKVQLSPAGFSFSDSFSGEKNFQFKFHSETDWSFQEKIGYKNSLFIIGGGHCALALSKIMSMMDFYIQVYETREHLHTMMQNDFVHKKHFIGDYTKLEELISSGTDHFVIVMTVGYRTDEKAVKALLSKDFRYFGLLGSIKKINKLLTNLKREGYSEARLDKIFAPVGLPINSQTPEEIAISIAAQIIRIKNSVTNEIKNTDPKKIFSD